MTRRCCRRPGFKLVDLLVAVFVTGLLIALFLPALNTGVNINRAGQCRNNMRQIGLGLIAYSDARNAFPQAGTFFDDPDHHQGDPLRSNVYKAVTNPAAFSGDPNACRSDWVVALLPYIDNQELYNAWSFRESYLSTVTTDPTVPSNAVVACTSIGILRCPDDETTAIGQGNLSYAVNGGFVRWHAVPVGWDSRGSDGLPGNGGVLRWATEDEGWAKTQEVCRKLGVMSLGTSTGDQPWDVRTRPADLTDGAMTTILVAENTHTGYSMGTPHSGGLKTNWACPLPNFCLFMASDDVCTSQTSTTDCLGGQLRPTPRATTGAGWSRANSRGSGEGINDRRVIAEGSAPFAASGHPGGVNVTFCDGSVRRISETIDGTVYARLITPSGESLPEAIRQGPVAAAEIAP